MNFNQALPALAVRDLPAATSWYEKLLGRPADTRPMESLVEWTITDTSTLQVSSYDLTNAGRGQIGLTVDSVEAAAATLRERGMEVGDVLDISDYVRILPLTDPEGNIVNLLEPR